MRLDNSTYTTLKDLAKKYNIGVSTLLRAILVYTLRKKGG